MGAYTIRPLGVETWDAFAALAEKHNGVWNGCFGLFAGPACADSSPFRMCAAVTSRGGFGRS